MKTICYLCLTVLFISLSACSSRSIQPEVATDPPTGLTSEARVGIDPSTELDQTYVKHIVVLKAGQTGQTRDSLAEALDKTASHFYNSVFIGFAADVSLAELDVLSTDSRVAYVEEDIMLELCAPLLENNPADNPWDIVDNITGGFAIPEPVEGPIRFEGSNPADWGVSRMNAFPSPGLQGAGVTVAIIDTGIDLDHPDLVGAIVAEYDAIDDIEGVGTGDDLRGHGSHVAGIVGARDNAIATVGIAPLCSLASIQVFADGGGGTPNSTLIRGIDWITANQSVVVPPIKVANMSLSGTGTSRATYDAIQAATDAGITVVVAAGNDFRDASQQMPANFDNVITVSAMRRVWTGVDYDYRFATFSNFGNTIDLIAPGQSILSLWWNGSTRFASGTSMACPHVAGMAALYLDENLTDGFATVQAALIADGEIGTWSGDPDGVFEPMAYTNEVVPTWHTQAVDTLGIVGEYTSLAVVDGNPAISYMDGTNGDLKFLRATSPDGSTWGTPLTLDSAGLVGQFTSMVVVNGNPAISYYDNTNGDLKYIRATSIDGSTWGAPQTLDFLGTVGGYTSLAVINGNPAISYEGYTNADLKYIRATDANGSAWGAILTLDSVDQVGFFTSLVVVNGNPAISYSDMTNSDLKYVRATNADGSAWGAPLAIDTIGMVGFFSSMAVIDGNPAVSYHSNSTGALKYIRATNTDGSSWGTPFTIDSAAPTGQHTSLAFVGGRPAISYYDWGNINLNYVTASDSTGSSWETPYNIDATDVGLYTSLAVVNGYSAISYYDLTNGDLKFTYLGQ